MINLAASCIINPITPRLHRDYTGIQLHALQTTIWGQKLSSFPWKLNFLSFSKLFLHYLALEPLGKKICFQWRYYIKSLICQTIFQLLCRAADSDIQLMKISLTEYLLSIISRKSKIPHIWRNIFCVWRKTSISNFLKSFKLITQGGEGRPSGQDFKTF